MSAYYKYHTESGHIDTKIVVNDASTLAAHADPGYSFIEASEDFIFGRHYVTGEKTFAERENISTGGKLKMAAGEPLSIIGLPEDCWIRFGGDQPIATEDGHVDINKSTPGVVSVEIVGKYAGHPFELRWFLPEVFKAMILAEIDARAEEIRAAHATDGVGQAVTYLRKADAARTYIAGGALSDAQMQRLQDEAARVGLTLDNAARSLIEKADAWEELDATIDKVRLDAKAMVKMSQTGKEASDIQQAIPWPK